MVGDEQVVTPKPTLWRPWLAAGVTDQTVVDDSGVMAQADEKVITSIHHELDQYDGDDHYDCD